MCLMSSIIHQLFGTAQLKYNRVQRRITKTTKKTKQRGINNVNARIKMKPNTHITGSTGSTSWDLTYAFANTVIYYFSYSRTK